MRQVRDVTITADGRDKGKVFQLTEMPAMRAEKWALRALLAIAKGGVELPDGAGTEGMASLVVAGIQAITKLDMADAEPLLDEMMLCVRFIPNPREPGVVRDLLADDIEEVATLLTLRQEVWALHTGFSFGDKFSLFADKA